MEPTRKMEVLVAMPTVDDKVNTGLSKSLIEELHVRGTPPLRLVNLQSSLLGFGFNQLWCIALNNRHMLSHFLMLHSDIVPQEPGFVQTLLGEMERTGAGVLGAVVPLKSDTGVTSTALAPSLVAAQAIGAAGGERRRLTLQELEALPETFDAQDAAQALDLDWREPVLLVNTGMLLVDLRQPWVEQAWFTITDTVWQRPDGKFVCDVLPEDWFFSLRAAAAGARVCATRKVKLEHVGSRGYPNQGAWGTARHDLDEE